jgi:hypothetical protein
MKADGDGDLRVTGNGSINGSPAWAHTLLYTWYALLRGNTPAVAAARCTRPLYGTWHHHRGAMRCMGGDGAWRACASRVTEA